MDDQNKHLLVAIFRGSRLTVDVHLSNSSSLVPYNQNEQIKNGLQILEYDFCVDEFRQAAVRVLAQLRKIELKLRNQQIGVNVAKTMTTGQGVLGAALCFISGPVGVAVAGIGAAATGATFCLDTYLNRKRARQSHDILEKDEFLDKMKRVMQKFNITDEQLQAENISTDSSKFIFDEDIDHILQNIFKFVTDNRIADIFTFLGLEKSATATLSDTRQGFQSFSELTKQNGLLEAIQLSPISKVLAIIGALLQVYDCYNSWKFGNQELRKTTELCEKIEALLNIIADNRIPYTVTEPDTDSD